LVCHIKFIQTGSQFTSEMIREVYKLLDVKQSTTTPYHAMGNCVVENFNKTIKNLLKKVAAERPKDWHRYLGPLMFAVCDTPQDSTAFTPFEMLYGYRVRTPMTLLKRIWTGKEEDSEVKTAYHYVVDLRERIEETCELAKNELSKVQVRNQKYYNRSTRERKLHVGDSVLLLLPTEQNKVTLAWHGPYKVVGTVGEVDYKIETNPGKVKTYHINMLKRYFHRENEQKDVLRKVDKRKQEARITNGVGSENQEINQAASVACVLEDEETHEPVAVNDADTLPLYNLKQKEPHTSKM